MKVYADERIRRARAEAARLSKRPALVQGRLDGVFDYGAAGIVPLIRLDIPKPRLVNNGYAVYGGHPEIEVPGLFEALAESPDLRPDVADRYRSGHVMIYYADGERFGSFAGSISPDRERFVPA
jgi:hypothetical protein